MEARLERLMGQIEWAQDSKRLYHELLEFLDDNMANMDDRKSEGIITNRTMGE